MTRLHFAIIGIAIIALSTDTSSSVFAVDRLVKGNSSKDEVNIFANATEAPATELSAATDFQLFDVSPSPPLTTMQSVPVACANDRPWYFQAEALFLRRDNDLSNQPVVFQIFDNGDPDLLRLSTGDLSSDIGYGQRYVLGRFLEDDSAIEFVYFGIIDWSGSSTVTTGGNDLKLPSDLGQNITTNDFSGADQMTVSNISYLNNAEFHWVGTLSGSAWNGASVLAGFRYVGFNETLNIHASDVEPDLQPGSDYRIKTTNNLFGAQLGGRVARRNDRWGWDVTGKVGLFGNAARQEQYVYDDNNTFPIRPDVGAVGSSISSSRGSVAFVGDLNTSLVLQLTDTWALRGGYNLIWIEGVALGGNQLDFTNTTDSGRGIGTSGGGLFLHGASVGLEAHW